MECKGKGWVEVDDGNGDGNTHAEPCGTCEFFDFIADQEAMDAADYFRDEDEDEIDHDYEMSAADLARAERRHMLYE